MGKNKEIYLTEQGLEELKEEYNHLINVDRDFVEEAALLSGIDCHIYEIFMTGHAPSPEDSEKILNAWNKLRAQENRRLLDR